MLYLSDGIWLCLNAVSGLFPSGGGSSMKHSIRKVRQGDEKALAYIQTESWKAAFGDILSPDVLENATDLTRATAMYKRFSLHGQGLNSSVWFSYFGYAANIV